MPRVYYRGWDSSKANMSGADKREFQTNMTEEAYGALENGARALKRAMENTRDKIGEQRFYELELRARRRRDSTKLWQRLLSLAYGATSDYGASIVKPLGGIVVLWIVFALIYCGFRTSWLHDAPPVQTFIDALNFSASAIFRGFSFWSIGEVKQDDFARALLIDGGDLLGLGIKLIATLQSFTSIILVFLTALAARRYFQLS
ncbi:MAG: hypothetical protein K2Q06_12845 [Parvularculaceae bacterium]|nr:hypothetical protein [Parvularculaceae bacterium]